MCGMSVRSKCHGQSYVTQVLNRLNKKKILVSDIGLTDC